ncbi:TPA: type II toxin-antitoxin system RelB/DinJ family antitoxin [Enterobacter hormaechei subsp. steigerwaltii]
MATVNVNVRIDAELKQSADEAMLLAGTTPTQAITLLYQYIAENKRLPFITTKAIQTHAELEKEIYLHFHEGRTILKRILQSIEICENIEGQDFLYNYEILNKLHATMQRKLQFIDENIELSDLSVALKKSILTCGNFTNFGYGKKFFKVTTEEYANLNAEVEELWKMGRI